MVLGGVVLGLYLGLYVCFVGGIWTMIQMLLGKIALSFGAFAWAAIKILLASAIGWGSFALLAAPGAGMMGASIK